MKSESNVTLEKATFAGGCFWCIESIFKNIDGIISVVSGYAGGKEIEPTYEEVSAGETGHREAVQITYNAEKIDYEVLLKTFWHQIDPTDTQGQFSDKGFRYTTAIFYHDEKQRVLATMSKIEFEDSKKFDKPITTQILPFTTFYPAEEYHQGYSEKNPIKYKAYYYLSGRQRYLDKKWRHSEDLREKLTPIQYKVTQTCGTEPAFDNEYWDNKEEGIYVDVVSGEPLFSSKDKFDSGTGWPSFTRPLEPDNIIEKKDYKLILPRTEVKSKNADSHLGHVFSDGPQPTGLRYCINSAALKFIAKKDLKKQGYEKYLKLFE